MSNIIYYCRKEDNIDLIGFQKLLFNKYKSLYYTHDNKTNEYVINKNPKYDIVDNIFAEYNYIYFRINNNHNRLSIGAVLNLNDIQFIEPNTKIINIKNYLLTEKLKTII